MYDALCHVVVQALGLQALLPLPSFGAAVPAATSLAASGVESNVQVWLFSSGAVSWASSNANNITRLVGFGVAKTH